MIKVYNPEYIYSIFPDFDRRFKLKSYHLLYVLYMNDVPVSCLTVAKEGKKYIKIHGAFTPIRFRRKGFLTVLLKEICLIYSGYYIKADCLCESIGVFLKCGFRFVQKKYCRNYTLYQTVKEPDYGEAEN